MKTLVIWDQVGGDDVKMFWLDGDYSHLNRVYINSTESSGIQQDELHKIVYNDDGSYKVQTFVELPLTLDEPGVSIIVAGFIC